MILESSCVRYRPRMTAYKACLLYVLFDERRLECPIILNFGLLADISSIKKPARANILFDFDFRLFYAGMCISAAVECNSPTIRWDWSALRHLQFMWVIIPRSPDILLQTHELKRCMIYWVTVAESNRHHQIRLWSPWTRLVAWRRVCCVLDLRWSPTTKRSKKHFLVVRIFILRTCSKSRE